MPERTKHSNESRTRFAEIGSVAIAAFLDSLDSGDWSTTVELFESLLSDEYIVATQIEVFEPTIAHVQALYALALCRHGKVELAKVAITKVPISTVSNRGLQKIIRAIEDEIKDTCSSPGWRTERGSGTSVVEGPESSEMVRPKRNPTAR